MKKTKIKSRMRFKWMVLITIIYGCNSYNEKQKKDIQQKQNCKFEDIQELKNLLTNLSKIILMSNPILIKNSEADSVEINKEVSGQIDSVFLKYCKEIEQEIEFERFALIYLYNFKFNQYKCCVPGEAEIIGEYFMNTNHEKEKDGFGIAFKYLLRKNGVTKNNIIYNGFTQAQINFHETIKNFENDSQVVHLVKKANDEMKKAYQMKN